MRRRTARSLSPSNKEDLQPVFLHLLPVDYYLERIHSYSAVGTLALASGRGHAAQACLTKRLPYMGFGLTETHVIKLEKFLTNWVRDMMATEGHPLRKKGAGTLPKDTKEKETAKEQSGKERGQREEMEGVIFR